MFKWSTFKNFLKFSFFVAYATMVTNFAIDLIQEKNNLMDIEEYSPKSSLVVAENQRDREKFPFVDVHSHQWKKPVMDFTNLVA